jgi:hypothetical protein
LSVKNQPENRVDDNEAEGCRTSHPGSGGRQKRLYRFCQDLSAELRNHKVECASHKVYSSDLFLLKRTAATAILPLPDFSYAKAEPRALLGLKAMIVLESRYLTGRL